MASFILHARRGTDNEEKKFLYCTNDSSLTEFDTNRSIFRKADTVRGFPTVNAISPDNPGRKTTPTRVRIKLGSSCNYSCAYCLQGRKTSTKQIEFTSIVTSLKAILPENTLATLEFWGGEPLLYWKTLLPLATELRKVFPSAKFATVTNGSLLTKELISNLVELGFYVVVSHDGPGQSIRGEDPLDNPEILSAILEFQKQHPTRLAFNPTLSRSNPYRTKIVDWFISKLGPEVKLSDGRLLGFYTKDSLTEDLVFQTREEVIAFRKDKLEFLRGPNAHKFNTDPQLMLKFMLSIHDSKSLDALPQGCGEDLEHILTVNMKGEVLTCVNVQEQDTNYLGTSHVIGNIDALDEVRLNTSFHWSKRKFCSQCPVLHLCAGFCMHLEDGSPEWTEGCNNKYSDNIVTMAAFLEAVTGFLPYKVEGVGFDVPKSRELIWE